MKRDDLVNVYIGALDARIVAILVAPDGKSSLCPGPAPDENPFDVLWFAKSQHAELVLAQCPEGWVDLTPAALRDEVVNAAATLGAQFRTSAEVKADAERTVEQIVDNVERARIKGELRKVNLAYKAYRQGQLALGKKPIGYGEHLSHFTRDLVMLAAAKANGF